MMRFSVKLPSSRPPHGHGSECVGGWVGPVCGSRIEAQLAAEAARRRAQARLRRRQSGGQDKLDAPGLEEHGDDTSLDAAAAAAAAEASGTSMETAAVAPSAQVVEVEVEALREEVTRLRAENARLTHSLHQCRQQGPPPPPPPPSPPQAGAR